MMWPFYEKVLHPDVPLKDKVSYLNLINNIHKLRFEQDADIQSVIEKIQELINSPLTRFEGHVLLEALLTNHPKAYVQNWGLIVTGSLSCPDSQSYKQLTLRILQLIVVNFSKNMPCVEAFQRFLPPILNHILKARQNEESFLSCCQTLNICMQNLPTLLGPHSEEIEEFLLKNLDTISPAILEAISDCFASIPMCRVYLTRPKPPFSVSWSNTFLKTTVTIQQILHQILKYPEAENGVEDGQFLCLSIDDHEEESISMLRRFRIFSSLCNCLAKMLRPDTNFNHTIEVPIPNLLKCLSGIYEVKNILKQEIQTSSVHLLAYPLMQNAVLVVVEALVLNFSIVEHSGNFLKIIRESLSVASLPNFTQSSMRHMRSNIWKVLNMWLKQYGAKGSYEIAIDRHLIREVLKDVALDSEAEYSQENGTAELSSDSFGETCCIEALQVVQNITTAGGTYMKKEVIDEMLFMLVTTAKKVQKCLHPGKIYPYPYRNEKCRLKLYESLLSGSLFGDPLQTKYMTQAINIFTFATRDQSLEIIAVCQKALKMYRFFLNPRKSPPEALTCFDEESKSLPSPKEVQRGWEFRHWNVSKESPERAMEIQPIYNNAANYDGQRDSLNARTPIHYPDTHDIQNQCNGDNSRVVSSKPSHSSICNDSESEIEEYREGSLSDSQAMPPIDIPPIAPTPIISSIEAQVIEQPSTSSELKILELKPVIPEKIAPANDDSVHDVLSNCIEGVQVENQNSALIENGMDAESEDEESGEEEDEEGTGSEEEEEEDNEAINQEEGYSSDFYADQNASASERCSPEYYNERPVKKQKMSHEEELSSEEYEEEKSPVHAIQNLELNQEPESEEDQNTGLNESPTVEEMCQDFVLAEPEELTEQQCIS